MIYVSSWIIENVRSVELFKFLFRPTDYQLSNSSMIERFREILPRNI